MLKKIKNLETILKKIVDISMPSLWGHFKDGVLGACDEVSGVKRTNTSIGDALWWDGEVKEAILQEKNTYKVMCTLYIVHV